MSVAIFSMRSLGADFLRYGMTILLFVTVMVPAYGQQGPKGGDEATSFATVPLPDIYCFSGSPLLLQVNVPNPGQSTESIFIKSPMSSFSYSVASDQSREELQFYINPFLYSGLYELEVALQNRGGAQSQSLFDVGFVDFVWGRDNLSFGNNSSYNSVIGSFGEILEGWLNKRFGDVDDADTILLVDQMYGLFGKNTGRCYAFAGTEVRYWRWPELLPTYYNSAHDLRGSVARYQREMNYLQFDIVFDHFFAGPGSDQIRNPMNIMQLEEQASLIEKRITDREPVVVAFAGPDIHHSMLVFGIIRNHTTNTVDLLVANNWKNDEKLNIHSRDAEIIRLYLSPDLEEPIIQWRYDSGVRSRVIDRLFVVDVRRDPYEHERIVLDSIIAGLQNRLASEKRVVVVVEEAESARIVNGEQSSGWFRNRKTDQLEGVWFERVGDTYRFTCPAEANFELEIVDSGGARVLAIAPGAGPSEIAHFIHVTEPIDDEPTTRRIPLPGVLHAPVSSASPGSPLEDDP